MHLILIREIKLHSIRDRTLVADYSSQEALIHYTKRFNHFKKHKSPLQERHPGHHDRLQSLQLSNRQDFEMKLISISQELLEK